MLVDDRGGDPELGRQRRRATARAAPLRPRQRGDQGQAEAKPHAAAAEMGEPLVDPPGRQVGRDHPAEQHREP